MSATCLGSGTDQKPLILYLGVILAAFEDADRDWIWVTIHKNHHLDVYAKLILKEKGLEGKKMIFLFFKDQRFFNMKNLVSSALQIR